MDAKKASQPTWETVRYMISVIQYGGRITDDFDQLLMDTYAEKYFHPGVLQVGRRGGGGRLAGGWASFACGGPQAGVTGVMQCMMGGTQASTHCHTQRAAAHQLVCCCLLLPQADCMMGRKQTSTHCHTKGCSSPAPLPLLLLLSAAH